MRSVAELVRSECVVDTMRAKLASRSSVYEYICVAERSDRSHLRSRSAVEPRAEGEVAADRRCEGILVSKPRENSRDRFAPESESSGEDRRSEARRERERIFRERAAQGPRTYDLYVSAGGLFA